MAERVRRAEKWNRSQPESMKRMLPRANSVGVRRRAADQPTRTGQERASQPPTDAG